MVVKILAGSKILGKINVPDADLLVFDSKGEPHDPQERVGHDVIAYIKKARRNENFSCVYSRVNVTATSVVDSGVAAVEYALAVIHGNSFDQNLDEVACWGKRERFMRQCVESATANARRASVAGFSRDVGRERREVTVKPEVQKIQNNPPVQGAGLRRVKQKVSMEGMSQTPSEKGKLKLDNFEKESPVSPISFKGRKVPTGTVPMGKTTPQAYHQPVVISDDSEEETLGPETTKERMQRVSQKSTKKVDSQGTRERRMHFECADEEDQNSYDAFMGRKSRVKKDSSARLASKLKAENLIDFD